MTDSISDAAAAKTRWLDPDQQRAWRAYMVGTTLLTDRLDDELRDAFGIGLNEYEVLVRLSEREDHSLRMSALADAMRFSRSRVTHTIKRMEAAGWVRRSEATDDGRGIFAHLTETGFALLVRAAPIHVAGVRAHLVDLVAGDDFAAMGRVMDAVVDQLAEDHPEADLRTPGS
ncbi:MULTISPECIES: MarR family winged helix-turn-helix transcriptional regulator [unclassified Nocardioides]|uniref:MarR family winged helix-turn-helix transcriptional regulator n=1 Tax=unclassified Nocardioides TaxID=2615069 RepID=UPI000701BF22|nr:MULTISPECIES: MarR family transcriptional regulator [unclassified Nocardioides]KQY63634.1 MarR family transcriptional regulator [Nocardioides sp. Root140]KRF15650.1 MarR family transcriptional regulator [Nocardioides sp. Soil796]